MDYIIGREIFVPNSHPLWVISAANPGQEELGRRVFHLHCQHQDGEHGLRRPPVEEGRQPQLVQEEDHWGHGQRVVVLQKVPQNQ